LGVSALNGRKLGIVVLDSRRGHQDQAERSGVIYGWRFFASGGGPLPDRRRGGRGGVFRGLAAAGRSSTTRRLGLKRRVALSWTLPFRSNTMRVTPGRVSATRNALEQGA